MQKAAKIMPKKMNKIEKLIDEICPDGVEFLTLNDVSLSIKAGGDLPENYQKGQIEPTKEFPYPIYSNGSNEKALYGYTDTYKIDNEAVTISARGTIGYHTLRAAKFTPIIRLIILIPDTKLVTPQFLNYALDITEIGHSGGSIPQLTVPNVKKIKIPIPPLEIQKEIVKILDNFTKLEAELEAELEARKKQYEYYREKLLTFGDGVEFKELGMILERNKGTKITATQMKELNTYGAPIKIFAGGKTFAMVNLEDIPEKDVHKMPSIIVKSRGIIEFEYYNKPFSHKNEFWSYYSKNKDVNIKYVAYYLKMKEPYFQNVASKMQMPQISLPDTEKFKIPLPSISKQERIVAILDKFDALVNGISTGLPAELNARRKQYEYYRNQLLTFKSLEKQNAK